ncbi:MAG: LptF/LptG family permease [Spirochaetia bacterium]|nr:LptF/LptG family permease [Spirochaetia bacterium]
MSILDRYIFTEFMKNFLGALVLLIGVGLISKVMETLGIIMKYDGALIHVWRFYYKNIPNMITIVTPPALLFSISFSMASFTKNMEMAVIMAAGRSLKRIMLPLVLFSLLLSFFLLWFNEMVTAPSNFGAYNELNIIKGNPSIHRLYDQTNFAVKAKNRYYHIGKFIAERGEARGVHIVEFSSAGHIQRIIDGEKVNIHPNEWHFTDGSVIFFNKKGELINREFFKNKKLSFPEAADYFQTAAKKFEETNVFDLMRYISEKKERAESFIEYEVEFYWHLGYPFICFFVVFLGGMIGSYLKRGAMAQSMGIAIVLSAVYYLVMFFGKSLGNNGTLHPFIAGWLANIVFLAVTAGFFIKERK